MAINVSSSPCVSLIREFGRTYKYDLTDEERVELAKFIGQVGQQKYKSIISSLLQKVLEDNSIIVVEAGLDACIEILQTIYMNYANYEYPGLCISELKFLLVCAFNRHKNSRIRLRIMTIFKDLAMFEVREISSIDLKSTIDVRCLILHVRGAVDLLKAILLESPGMSTVDHLNCLGLLLSSEIRRKYQNKINGLIQELFRNSSRSRKIDIKHVTNALIMHYINNPSSSSDARTVIAELKKINPQMHRTVLQAISGLDNARIMNPKKIETNEYDKLASNLESITDLKRAVNYCQRENNFSLLFNCTPTKLEAMFRTMPGLRTKLMMYAKNEIKSSRIQLRKRAILKNITRRF